MQATSPNIRAPRSSFARRGAAVLTTAFALGACGETPVAGPAHVEPAFSSLPAGSVGPATCPTTWSAVVGTEPELLDAVAGAAPGDVIGIDGLIELSQPVIMEGNGVTLTCVSAGSGVRITDASLYALEIRASDIAIRHLVVDAGSGRGAIRAQNNGSTRFAHGTEINRNEVTCGSVSCMFFAGVAEAKIQRNFVVAPSSAVIGVHLQGQGPFAPDGRRPRMIDGTRVDHNLIVAEAPSINQFFGGIRLRDGRDVSGSFNTVLGPWQNSMSIDDLKDSRIRSNELQDAIQYGILIGINSPVVAGTRGTSFDFNAVDGAGEIGIWMPTGCSNSLRWTELTNNGTAGIDGIHFSPQTGDNLYVGDLGVVDADWGDFDCDGDGISDPNTLLGPTDPRAPGRGA